MDPRLYEAARAGNLITLKELLSKKPALACLPSRPTTNTILHIAAKVDNLSMLELICHHYPQLIEKKNSRGNTPLYIAIQAGNLSVVTYLIDHVQHFISSFSAGDGEEENDKYVLLRVPNKDGDIPLHEAVRGRNPRVIEVLLRADPKSAFIANKNGESPLYIATDRGFLDIVDKILLYKDLGDMEEAIYQGPNGQTPLHAAVARQDTEMVNLLLRHRKELVKTEDKDGRTPLHHAASFGYLIGVSILLQYDNTCAYIKDKDGFYPLHMAVIKSHINIIQELLKSCPDLRDIQNEYEQNILHFAASWGRKRVAKSLLNNSDLSDLINERDANGNTPLHLATINRNPKVVSILVCDKRVDMAITNGEGLTPRDIVEQNIEEHTSFRKLLTQTALRTAGAPRGQQRPLVEPNRQHHRREYDKVEFYKERINTLALIATLIATVSFAAGFTLPGGNINDGPSAGAAIMLDKFTFQLFLICNAIAMYSSIIGVFVLIWAQWGDINLLVEALRISLLLLGVALTMMAMAFASAIYLVVNRLRWLVAVVLLLTAIFLLCIVVLFVPLRGPIWSKYRGLRIISYYAYHILILIVSHQLDDIDD